MGFLFNCIFNVTNHDVNRLIPIELAFRIPQRSSLDVLPVSMYIHARSSIVFSGQAVHFHKRQIKCLIWSTFIVMRAGGEEGIMS